MQMRRILSVLILPFTVGAADNLLRNTGFEQGITNWAASGVSARYSIVKDAGRNGGAALRYEKRSADAPNENSIFAQEVAVQPETLYVAAIWTKTEGQLRPVIRIATMNWDTLAFAAAGPSRDWQRIQIRFDSGPNRRIRFQIYGGSMGQIRQSEPGLSYFDEASLRPGERRGSCRAARRPDIRAAGKGPPRNQSVILRLEYVVHDR